MAGEPIIIHYKITNPSEAALNLTDRGLDEGWWITFELLGEKGKPVRPVNGSPPRPPVDIVFGNHSVERGETVQGRVAAGAGATLPAPGHYTLVAHIRLLYQATTPKTPEDRLHYVTLSRDVKIPVRVTRTDRAHLQRLAESLAQQVLQSQGVTSETRTALIALFSIPPSIALPAWEAMLNDPALTRGLGTDIVVQLSRLNSRMAVELLSEVWAGARWPEQVTMARSMLLVMYRDGNPMLRPAIRQLFIHREGQFHPLLKIKAYDIDG